MQTVSSRSQASSRQHRCLLRSLYENSFTLTSGELTTVELLVDSGANPINSVGTRVTFPPDLVEIVEVRTQCSIRDQGLSVPVNDQGEVQVNCQISGDGYAGASAVVTTFVLRAKSGGHATPSFDPKSSVTVAGQTVNKLGSAPEMLIAIDRELPQLFYPETITPRQIEEGLSIEFVVVMLTASVTISLIAFSMILFIVSSHLRLETVDGQVVVIETPPVEPIFGRPRDRQGNAPGPRSSGTSERPPFPIDLEGDGDGDGDG